jgi:thioredoxin 1
MAGKTFEATTSNFNSEVLGSDTPVLVDFWAEWCGPCKMIAPIVEELANEYDGKLKVAKLDADENQDVLMSYGVMGIPTLILFKGGEVVGRVTGYKPKAKIVAELNLVDQVN